MKFKNELKNMLKEINSEKIKNNILNLIRIKEWIFTLWV